MNKHRWTLILALGACGPPEPKGAAGRESAAPEPEDSTPQDSAPPGDTAGDTGEPAPDPCEGLVWPALALNEVLAANLAGITDADGDTSDWIEIVSREEQDVDLDGWSLEDADGESWTFGPLTLSKDEILLVFASGDDSQGDPDLGEEIHTSFKLKASDAGVLLRSPEGCVVDAARPARLYGDISFGRPEADRATWGYFLEPTPGAENSTESRPGFAETPTLSPDAGLHEIGLEVEIGSDEEGATFTYSLDGSEPDEAATPYEGPLAIDASTQPVVVRARAFVDGLWPSRVATGTYLQDGAILEAGMYAIFLSVEPEDLWDDETGIYAYGTDYEPWYPYFGANFWNRWEKPAHVEVWDADGDLVLDQDAGIAIQGGYTRAFDQKSLRLYARSAYGPDSFEAALFETEEVDEYESFSLQIGMDWCSTHVLETAMGSLFRDPDGRLWPSVDIGAWAPAQVWLNGQYWGYYNMRERPNDEWIETHRGYDRDELDRVELGWTHEPNWELEQGTWDAFDAMNDFVIGADLSDPDTWAAFDAMVDLDSLASIVLIEAYSGNTDWWYNNLRLWRPATDEGQWRWIAFDFGHGWPTMTYDHIATSVAWTGDGLPVADALENEAFRVLLANQAADYLNTSLSAESALATLDDIASQVEPAMEAHYERWCDGEPVSNWYADIRYAQSFVTVRGDILREQVMDHLGLEGTAKLNLTVEPEGAGRLQLTAVTVDAPFSGTWYTGIPVTVTAVPAEGYTFIGWDDESLGDAERVEITLEGDASLEARFEAAP